MTVFGSNRGDQGAEKQEADQNDASPAVSNALAWLVARFALTFLLELFGLSIIARLVTPAEIGLFVATFAVIRFGQFVAAFGTHLVVIRSPEINGRLIGHVVTTLFVTTMAAGLPLLAFLLADSTIIWSAEAQTLVAIMLPGLVLNSIAVPANALLTRNFRFRTLFFLHLAASLTFQAVAIPLAALEFAGAALAVATLSSTVVFAMTTTVATRAVFLARPVVSGIGETTRFGATIFMTWAADEAQRVLVTLAIGRIGGAAQLGLYSRADDLISKLRFLLQETAISLATPLMFRAARRRGDLSKVFLDALDMMLAFTLPAGLGLALLSGPVVGIFLGPQWTEVGPVLAILALLIAIYPFGALATVAALALGRQVAVLCISYVRAAAIVATVVLLVDNDLRLLAGALVVAGFGSHVLTTSIVWRVLGLSLCSLLRAAGKSVLVTSITLLPAILIAALGQELGDVWRIILTLPSSVAAWVGALTWLRHPLRDHARDFIADRNWARYGGTGTSAEPDG